MGLQGQICEEADILSGEPAAILVAFVASAYLADIQSLMDAADTESVHTRRAVAVQRSG
jgi:hypothetical protein